MFFKNFLFIILFLISCSSDRVSTTSIIESSPRKLYKCEDKVAHYLKVEEKLSRDNVLSNLDDVYKRKLYENIMHLMISYPNEGDHRNIEIKYDIDKNKFLPILGMIKNDFEEKLADSYFTADGFLGEFQNYKQIYKQSFYFFGEKKLFVEYNHDEISQIFLGKDFSCRFEKHHTKCQCAKFFR